jgi:DNA-binding response OmpR family regulator
METLQNKTVVLIEDNELLSKIIIQKLQLLGANVYHYSNGLEGLAGVRHFQPDLVLLDILLPVMNGYEVLQVMQNEQMTERYPVLVISNSGQPVELARVHQLGAKDYLVKADFTPDEVLDKARVILQNHAQSKGAPVPVAKPTEPVSEAPKNTTEVAVADNTPNGKGQIRVIVVEDDPMLRNMLSMKFSKQDDFIFMFVSDGSQAVETIRSFAPAVVVLDLMLPGMNGLEILAELKKDPETQTIPVLILTNKSDDEDKQKARELGAEKYLIKAMTDLNDLIAFVRQSASS